LELVGDFSRTIFSKNKNDFVPHDPLVHGSQTRLEKGGKVCGVVDDGHTGQDGHEPDESRGEG
jgi:hypothetical protein